MTYTISVYQLCAVRLSWLCSEHQAQASERLRHLSKWYPYLTDSEFAAPRSKGTCTVAAVLETKAYRERDVTFRGSQYSFTRSNHIFPPSSRITDRSAQVSAGNETIIFRPLSFACTPDVTTFTSLQDKGIATLVTSVF